MKRIIILSMFFSFLFSDNGESNSNFSNSFERVFRQKEIITLSQSNELIGHIRAFQVDDEGNLWILDSKIGNIKKYNERGDLVFSFGRKGDGPGEFMAPFGFFISKDNIYVVDPKRRAIFIFDKNGKFKDSFKIKDGREIKLDRKGSKIIVSAPWVESKEGGHCIHVYDIKGKLVKSFLPIPEIILKNMFSDWVYFDLDEENNIYAVSEMEYKIYKFTENGELLKTFSKINKYYTPPPSKPFKGPYLKEALDKWIRSWTHITGVNTLKSLLIVGLKNIEPEYYILDIYNLNGDYILGGLKTSYRLLHTDKKGNLYFLKEKEKGSKIVFSILKMSLNI